MRLEMRLLVWHDSQSLIVGSRRRGRRRSQVTPPHHSKQIDTYPSLDFTLYSLGSLTFEKADVFLSRPQKKCETYPLGVPVCYSTSSQMRWKRLGLRHNWEGMFGKNEHACKHRPKHFTQITGYHRTGEWSQKITLQIVSQQVSTSHINLSGILTLFKANARTQNRPKRTTISQ